MKDKHFPEKYLKKLNELAAGYTDTVEGADTEEIKKFILSSERNLYEIENERDANEKLAKMKEDLKEATAPFAEAKGIETAKIKYCLFMLESRGVRI
jgi:hypothetical protein